MDSYISIKEAAKILGVTPLTLRNWDKNGKLEALRHPINNYRVYKAEDLYSLLEEIKSGPKPRKEEKREFKKIVVTHIPGDQ
jgi:excisionase family DNA binding protein